MSLLRRVSPGSRTSVKLRAGNKRQWSSDGSHTVGLLMKIRNEANYVFLRKTYTLVQRKCYQWREMAWNCLNVMTQCFIGHLIIVRLENKCLKWPFRLLVPGDWWSRNSPERCEHIETPSIVHWITWWGHCWEQCNNETVKWYTFLQEKKPGYV